MTRYAMGVDPGGQHTGIILAELRPDGPVPVDGLTLDRREGLSGTPGTWAHRST